MVKHNLHSATAFIGVALGLLANHEELPSDEHHALLFLPEALERVLDTLQQTLYSVNDIDCEFELVQLIHATVHCINAAHRIVQLPARVGERDEYEWHCAVQAELCSAERAMQPLDSMFKLLSVCE